MPKKGFTTITINEIMYNKIKKRMKKLNEKAGYRKFRSVSHFVEEAVMSFNMDDESSEVEEEQR